MSLTWGTVQKQPISTVDFEDIEKKYNVIFPKDFKEFYLENNGLKIHLCLFDEKYEINTFLELRGEWSIESVKDEEIADEIIPNNMIPFGDDEGGDFYYINTNDGGVYLIRCEDIENYILIARSFTDFLGILDDSEMR